jgi:hypothetical protein
MNPARTFGPDLVRPARLRDDGLSRVGDLVFRVAQGLRCLKGATREVPAPYGGPSSHDGVIRGTQFSWRALGRTNGTFE